MKVTYERTIVKVKFGDIDCGDVFMWDNENLMRIQTILSRYGEIIANVVYVNNGKTAKLTDDEIVEPLDAELIIRG